MRLFRPLAVLFWLGLAVPAAADSGLEAVSATLATVSRSDDTTDGSRGATSDVTTAKHQLRDWLDGELSHQAGPPLPESFASDLNGRLRAAGLFCDADGRTCRRAATESFVSFLGGLGQIQMWQQGRVAVVATSVGIDCGFDDSVYAYGWIGHHWVRLFDYERNNYDDGPYQYQPQLVRKVLISPADSNNPGRFRVLTMGVGSWCSSNWLGVHYQLHRVDLGRQQARLLLDEDANAYLGDVPILGQLSSTDMQVAFTTFSNDYRTSPFRDTIRRYRLVGDHLVRVQPVAATPFLFMGEWLAEDWKASAAWTEPKARKKLRQWHQWLQRPSERALMRKGWGKLQEDDPTKDSPFLAQSLGDGDQCTDNHSLWQIVVDYLNQREATTSRVYFVVRQDAPKHFTMMDIGDQPRSGCPISSEQ